MAEQEIITRYKAIVDDQVKGIDLIIDKERQLVNSQKTQADAETTNAAKLKTAAQQRKILLDQEIANLKKLQEASKQAFTVKDISAFNQQINESQKRIAVLKGTAGDLSSVTNALKAQFTQIGAGILAAFSVNAVINFGKECVTAFIEAEENANKLAFAVKNIANESVGVFDSLIKQSKELQNITIFSDDEIQRAQTALITFGLTGQQVEKVIPKIANLASVSRKTFGEATDIFISGVKGLTRPLGDLGLKFDATGKEAENFNIILQKLDGFEGAAEEATKSLSGQLQQQKNRADELSESIGEKLAPAYVKAKVALFEFVNELLSPRTAALDAQGFTQQQIDFLDSVGFAANSSGTKIREEGQAIIQLSNQLQTAEKSLKAGTTSQKEFNELAAILIKQTKESNVSFETQQILLGLINSSLRTSRQYWDDLSKSQKANIDVSKLSDEELQKQLDKNKVLNTLVSRDLVTAIEAEQKARADAAKKSDEQARKASEERVKKAQETADKLVEIQKANSQKLIELRIKSEDDLKTVKAADDPIKKLDLEYDKRLQDAVRVFNLTKKSSEDRENLAATLANIEISFEQQVSDATIKIALETKKKLDDLNKDNAEKDLSDTLATIDLVVSEQKLALQKQFAERGDFSKEAADKLSKEISAVELNADIAKQKEIIASNASSNKEILEAKTKLNDDLAELSKAGSENEIEADDAATQKKIDNIFKILEVSDQVFSAIAQIESNASQKRIEALQDQLQASQDVLDKEQEAVDNQKNAKLISERDYESQSAVIKQKRIDSEKKINAAINAEKRKQAELDRALKIFEIAIQTAQNAVAVYGLTVPPGLLVPLAIALGALETAAVLSAPLPKFAKGTKDKKGSGMAIVGEEGEELVNLPSSSQVLPAPKTKKNRELINAMFDDKIDEYIHKKYVLPEVKNEKLSAMKKFEILKQVYEKEVVVNYNEKIFKQYEASKTISLNAIAKNYINSIVENRIDSKLSTKTIQLKEQINNFVNTKSIHEFTSNKPISPILMESKEKNRTAIQEQKSKNLAQNITNSFVNNKINSTGLDEHGMMRVNSKGIKIRNFEQLAEAIAQKIIQEENFRR